MIWLFLPTVDKTALSIFRSHPHPDSAPTTQAVGTVCWKTVLPIGCCVFKDFTVDAVVRDRGPGERTPFAGCFIFCKHIVPQLLITIWFVTDFAINEISKLVRIEQQSRY